MENLDRQLAVLEPSKPPAPNSSNKTRTEWPLDLPVVKIGGNRWFGGNAWTLEDAFSGLLITGANGSGKSSGPAALFSNKLLKLGCGGIVLCYKREEAAIWVQRMKDAGREDDIRVFGLDSPYKYNFLDFESRQKSSGLNQIDNLSNMLLNIASVRRTAPVGNEAAWFLPQKKLLIRSSLSLLLLAGVPLTLRAISRLLQSAPGTVDEARNKEWQKTSYLFSLLLDAEKKHPTHPELEEVREYWLKVRPAIGEKNRGPIDAEFTGMISGPLSRGQTAELFAGSTNLDPTACFDGKVIIVDLPVEEFEEAGQYAAMIWSVGFMKAALRRAYNPPHSRPVFLFADEAQAFSTDHDANFFATCRSHGIINVRMTQNLAGYIRSYGGGDQARLAVNQILGNLCSKIFLRNDDPETNAWASKLIAKDTFSRPSVSDSGSQRNTSISQSEELCCSEKEFLTLRNGGKKNNYTVAGIFFQAGREFYGDRFVIGEFTQSRKK